MVARNPIRIGKCSWCGLEVKNSLLALCGKHFELQSRIREEPEMAQRMLDSINRLLQAHHKECGTDYVIKAEGQFQCSKSEGAKLMAKGQPVVAYVSTDGSWYFRDREEFYDGRFEVEKARR